MRVLFVQQDHVSPPGPVGEAFVERGYDVDEFLVVPAEQFHKPCVTVVFPDPRDYDVVVPMGAPWSVYDDDAVGTWVKDEIEFVREAHDAHIPVLGICFGGQVLAVALGGDVVPADRAEVGWRSVTTQRPGLVEPGPWFQWHADRWVLPPGIEPFAHTPDAEQAFVVGSSLGLQFHPELTPDMLRGWLAHGGAEHARSLGLDPQLLVDETEATAAAAAQRARRLVHRFLDQVAGHRK